MSCLSCLKEKGRSQLCLYYSIAAIKLEAIKTSEIKPEKRPEEPSNDCGLYTQYTLFGVRIHTPAKEKTQLQISEDKHKRGNTTRRPASFSVLTLIWISWKVDIASSITSHLCPDVLCVALPGFRTFSFHPGKPGGQKMLNFNPSPSRGLMKRTPARTQWE